MMKWVIDLILLAVLLLCAWNGYKKGLIMEIGAMVCLAVSLYAACMLANTFSYEVVFALEPFAGGYIESVMTEQAPERLDYDLTEYSINDIVAEDPSKIHDIAKATFECLGVYEVTADELAEDVQAYMDENEVPLKTAVIDVTCNTVVYAAAVALIFLIILIFLTVLGNIPNLTFHLPNMEEVDEIGGALMGLLRGVVLCMLAVWVLKFSGLVIGEETLSNTILAKLLERIGFVSFFLGV